ncbi:uncharacterized protein Dvir_GJ26341 [Drosophila virilis]|uniref:Uncharacterized protein n=1 Tax=Drosophila virilis TaxID=7244 RepID=A0A0Q9W237_DROVI|nr:uncharacterized protein Dvir_GJ26341 [Drosophila virilis]
MQHKLSKAATDNNKQQPTKSNNNKHFISYNNSDSSYNNFSAISDKHSGTHMCRKGLCLERRVEQTAQKGHQDKEDNLDTCSTPTTGTSH